MHVEEPRDALMPFLVLWGSLFGGIPLIVLVVLPKSEAPAFLLLFPLIAAVVFSFGVRRSRRSGFHVTAEGLRGAHDDEDGFIPWEDVQRLAWRLAPDTSGVTVNDRPRPPGDALFLQRTDGSWVRVMQRVARSPRARERIDRDLAVAVAAGVLPVPVDAVADGDGGLPFQELDGPGTVTWGPTPEDQLHTWAPPPATHDVVPYDVVPDEVAEQLAEALDDPVEDEPHWPTADG